MNAQLPNNFRNPFYASPRNVDLLEQWLDFTFPLATALLLIDQTTCANTLLFIWLLSRLTIFSNWRAPQNLVLAGLGLASCGTIVLDQGGKPSDPSDLLVIGLAFVAGLKRSPKQWKQSASTIALCILPLAIHALLNKSGEVLQIPGINVNRLSFLLGLLTIAAYASYKWTVSRIPKLALGALAVLSIPLGLLTGSRAAIVAPALSIAAAWLICRLRQSSTAKANGIQNTALVLAAIASFGATTYLWYTNPKDSIENRINDTKRIETALCWFMAPIKEGKALSGLGFNEKVRSHCNGNDISYMRTMGHGKGLPHAHNIIGQIMGETGIPGLTALVGVIGLITSSIKSKLIEKQNEGSNLIMMTLPLCLYLATTGMTTSYYIYLMINQVLIGYLLAALASSRAEEQVKQSLNQRKGSWPAH